jgi:hypothetical protein
MAGTLEDSDSLGQLKGSVASAASRAVKARGCGLPEEVTQRFRTTVQ